MTTLRAPRVLASQAWLPFWLSLLAGVIVLVPNNGVFVFGAAIGAFAGAHGAIQIFSRKSDLRFSWLLAFGLLGGYCGGTVAAAVPAFSNGTDLATEFGRLQADLSMALAMVLWASSVLLLAGRWAEPPLKLTALRHINWSHSSSVWIGLLIIGLALVRGDLGYMGVSAAVDDHRITPLGAIAGLISPILPALTLCIRFRCTSLMRRRLLLCALGIEALALLPQGRRTLIYAAIVVVASLSWAGYKLRMRTSTKMLALIGLACVFYYANTAFYAMRFVYWNNGSVKLSVMDHVERTVEFLASGGGSDFDDLLSKNLESRPFILIYLSDLLVGLRDNEPLYGQIAAYSARMAVPNIIYKDKQEILDIGLEEAIANPQFGLPVEDDSNSVLTTGLSDFGIPGILLYPLALSITLGFCVRLVTNRLPELARFAAILSSVYMMIQAEVAGVTYAQWIRDLTVLCLALSGYAFCMNRIVHHRVSTGLAYKQAPPPGAEAKTASRPYTPQQAPVSAA